MNLTKRIILFGLGPHAKRIYFPLILKFSKEMNFELVKIVDLESKRDSIQDYLAKKGVDIEVYYISPDQQSYDFLHPKVEEDLNLMIREKKVDGIIIATEPLVHLMYAKWALQNGLSILMDKPISTYKDVSTSLEKAKKIQTDFFELEELYQRARIKNQNLSFSIMAQRRFHSSYQKIGELIKECFRKTNCPVTSIQSFHSDGEWRMPTEMIEQNYHPYNQGYGKCSHSGYHFFDLVASFLKAGSNNEKYFDNVEIGTNFVRPLDFMEQFNLNDYGLIFGKDNFQKQNKYSGEELTQAMKDLGELDAFSTLCFKKKNRIMAVATINLLHNGFSRREWLSSKDRDLYKGNGRVRQETHIIQQGPFQSIHYHSYQAREVDPTVNRELYSVGGEYHSDIYVFRNPLLGEKAFEIISIRDLHGLILDGNSRGHQEDARAKGFIEFIESLHGLRRHEQMSSDFSSHQGAVLIMSGIYQAGCQNEKIRLEV